MLILKFYQTERERRPAEEFIDKQPLEVANEIYSHLEILCRRFPYKRGPDIKHLRGKLWELRIRLFSKNYRLIFSVVAGKLVILNGFIKKRRREENEIKLASKRLKDYIQRFTK